MNAEETYSPRGMRAKRLFEQGYNCCQSVLLVFDDMTGLDDKTAARVASGFGAGIATLREVCGTFSGACMALGMIRGYDAPKSDEIRRELFANIKQFAKRFAGDNGSYICRELLGLDKKKTGATSEPPNDPQRRKRPCAELCAYSATLLEKLLEGNLDDRKNV